MYFVVYNRYGRIYKVIKTFSQFINDFVSLIINDRAQNVLCFVFKAQNMLRC